jgi:DNA-binding NtrC family response regulator
MAKILIIDDDEEMRRTLEQVLKASGHEVSTADEGRRGINQHKSAPVELAIVDLFMSGQEGLETITQFRRDFPEVAIIAMSGGNATSHSMLTVAKHLGAARTLEKPFDIAKLLATVDEALASRS